MLAELDATHRRQAILIVLVAALGYFVDIFDLLLFGMVRIKSLTDLGVAPADMLVQGGRLISLQMWGMLVGGVFWGILGDKRGRLSVLFGSIVLYSVANFANAYVTTVDQYAFWRFVAGLGLAGLGLADLDLTALGLAGARFFGGRFLVSPVVRRERGFAAMIPINPRRQHGMPRRQESRARFGAAAIGYGSPTRRRISAGVAPPARRSRKAVAPVDLASFCPAASRTSL